MTDTEPIVFDHVLVGRGLRALAQDGFVLVAPNTTMVRFTRGQTVGVTVTGRRHTPIPRR